MEEYEIEKILARGTFGTVYLVHLKNDARKRPVVIKRLSMEVFDNSDRMSTLNETKVLSMLKHPNIIRYYDSFLSPDLTHMYIVMEFAPGGTLHDLIELRRKSMSNELHKSESNLGYFQEEEIGHLFSQIVLALHLVHSHNIVHRDLKSQNVFLTRTLDHVKLGDFGISKILASKSQAHSVVGTPCYISPELCEGKSYNQKSDIWSIGCILYELCCLKRAFDAPNLPALILKISKGKVSGSIPSHYSQTLVKLIDWMLATDPEERPDITQVMAHHWVAPYVYKLPTLLGVIPCTSSKVNKSPGENPKNIAPLNYEAAGLLPFSNEQYVGRNSLKRSKCTVLKLSMNDVRTLPMPDFEVNPNIIQICGKNIALTESGNVIKWRTTNSKGSRENDSPSIECLLYDSYFKEKGVRINNLATSNHFECFITDRGILMTKGNGRYGCLGHGDRRSVIQPKIVEYFLAEEMKLIKCSDHHVIACTSNNDIFCWGQNVSNCFGLHQPEYCKETKIFCSPIRVTLPQEDKSCCKNVLKLFCAQGKTCILMNDKKTIYFAGNFNLPNKSANCSNGFCGMEINDDLRLIKNVGMTRNKTLILYEDGTIHVSTNGTYRCNIYLKINFENRFHLDKKVWMKEKITKILLKDVESNELCKQDEENCLVLCTNFNQIFVCHHFHCCLLSITDNFAKCFDTEKSQEGITEININDSEMNNFLKCISFEQTNDYLCSRPEILFDCKSSQISRLSFFQCDSKEKKPSLVVSFLSN